MIRFDIRSIALFRIALGCYLVYDVYSRFFVNFSSSSYMYHIAWYTTSPPGYFVSTDTPHTSHLHQIWFHRGSVAFQLMFLLVYVILTLLFTMGYNNNNPIITCLIRLLLWLMVVALQHQNSFLHDDSDNYVRQLLLWCCFLPVSDYWSVSARKKISTNTYEVGTIANVGITILILGMYWGSLFHRTFDQHTLSNFQYCEWLPPNFTAWYYILSGSLGIRNNMWVRMIRNRLWLSQLLTAMSVLVEAICPLLCVVLRRYSHYPALVLFLYHFGLCFLLNTINWQLLGMITTILWIPCHVWDSILLNKTTTTTTINQTMNKSDTTSSYTAWYKKTDGEEQTDTNKTQDTTTSSTIIISSTRGNVFSRITCWLLLLYMIYNWLGHRGWIAKLDNGDIGEGLRISQHWAGGMGSSVGAYHKAETARLIGFYYKNSTNTTTTTTTESKDDKATTTDEDSNDTTTNANTTKTKQTPYLIDLHYYIKHGQDFHLPNTNAELQQYYKTNRILKQSTENYPSTRWEHGFVDLVYRRDTKRAIVFVQMLCGLLNQDRQFRNNQTTTGDEDPYPLIQKIQMHWQYYDVLPPPKEQALSWKSLFGNNNNDSLKKYKKRYQSSKTHKDIDVTLPCPAMT